MYSLNSDWLSELQAHASNCLLYVAISDASQISYVPGWPLQSCHFNWLPPCLLHLRQSHLHPRICSRPETWMTNEVLHLPSESVCQNFPLSPAPKYIWVCSLLFSSFSLSSSPSHPQLCKWRLLPRRGGSSNLLLHKHPGQAWCLNKTSNVPHWTGDTGSGHRSHNPWPAPLRSPRLSPW